MGAAFRAAGLVVVVGLGLAACQRPMPWVDPRGSPVPERVLDETAGPEHCNWDSATFLRFQGEIYVRDPEGVFGPDDLAEGGYNPEAELPPGAVFTGFRERDRELWTSPLEGGAAVYVVTPDGVERWPRLLVGCD